VDYLGQIARALDKAHGLGIVHRDLKPENLFLERLPDGSNRVKILDFGVAKVRADEQGNPTLSGTLLGTPLYMAPEQAEGSSERVGPGTDMWSIGLIAYRLLVGRDYWSARSVSLLLVEILTGPIVAPSACGSPLGAEFDRWFLRSCDRDPEQRWPSVAAQVEALAHALDVPHPLLPSSPRAALADTMPSASDMTQPMPLMRVVEGISGADTMRSKRRIDIRAAIGIAALAVFAVAVAAALAMRKTPSVSNSAAPITAAASRLAPAPNPTWPVPASADHGASTTVTASSAVTNPSTSSSPAAAGSPATRAVLHRPPSTARTQPKKLDPLADPK
jgi:serine/threonine-protein kinase